MCRSKGAKINMIRRNSLMNGANSTFQKRNNTTKTLCGLISTKCLETIRRWLKCQLQSKLFLSSRHETLSRLTRIVATMSADSTAIDPNSFVEKNSAKQKKCTIDFETHWSQLRHGHRCPSKITAWFKWRTSKSSVQSSHSSNIMTWISTWMLCSANNLETLSRAAQWN